MKAHLLAALAAFIGVSANAQDDVLAPLAAPDDPIAFYDESRRAASLTEQGNWSEAQRLLRELVTEYPPSTAYAISRSNWGRLAEALRQQGKHREAIDALRRLMALQGPGLGYSESNAHYWIAVSQLALGDDGAAIEALQQMIADGYLMRPQLSSDPNFIALRDDPRFRALVGTTAVPTDRVAGWRGDIDHLVSEVRRSGARVGPTPDAFFAAAEDLKRRVPELRDDEMVAGIGNVLNILGRGHTALWIGMEGGRPTAWLPLALYVFADGVYVIGGDADLAGAKIIRFGEATTDEALARVAALQSTESPIEELWQAPQLLTNVTILRGNGLAPADGPITLTLRMPDGEIADRSFDPVQSPPPRKLIPPPGIEPPLFLRHASESHRFEWLPNSDVLYVQVNQIAPDEDETLAEFGVRLRDEIGRREPTALIVDLRHNNGGNSFSYVDLLRTLVAYSTGEGNAVYALIGRNVYSAAANFSSDLERLVRPIFVGEPTSQMGNQWGDESAFILPYSRLHGAVSGVRWQLSHPWDERDSIAPDVPVQLTAETYFAGRDPVLETTLRMIARESPP